METKLPIPGDQFTRKMYGYLKANRDRIDAKALSEFCGPRKETVNLWLAGTNPPGGGMVSLKLAYYLREMGVEIVELDEIHDQRPFSALLGELLAFDVIAMEEAQQLGGAVIRDTVLSAARGQDLVKRKNTHRELRAFIEAEPVYVEMLLFKMNDLRKRLGLLPRTEVHGIKAEQEDIVLTPESLTSVREPETVEPAPAVVVPEQVAPEPVITPPVVVYEEGVLTTILRENREQLTGLTTAFETALEKIVAQVQSVQPIASIDAGEAPSVVYRRQEPLDDSVELLCFVRDAATKVKETSVVVKLLLENTSPEVRALFRDVVGGSELRLLTHRLGKISGEHAREILSSKTDLEGE